MTKIEVIEMLEVGRQHAAMLRRYKKAELEAFIEDQTDPNNDAPVSLGDFVWIDWAEVYGVVTFREKVPASDRYRLVVTHGRGRVFTHTGDVRKIFKVAA